MNWKSVCQGLILTMLLLLANNLLAATALEQAFELYAGDARLSFNAERGKEMWGKTYLSKKDGKQRQCATCHGKDLTKASEHVKTGKPIDPMAPSVNKERFTKLKKIKKWFKRNCKWTLGRVCTDQEKGDLLKYLSQL